MKVRHESCKQLSRLARFRAPYSIVIREYTELLFVLPRSPSVRVPFVSSISLGFAHELHFDVDVRSLVGIVAVFHYFLKNS